MESDGGTKYVFFAGFETEEEAEAFCELYDWEFKDENDFVWKLYVEESRL